MKSKTLLHPMTSALKPIFNLTRLIRNTRIQTRLILLFLILSLVPLIITGIFSYKESSGAIKSKISTYSVQLMSQIGENIERELAMLENTSIEIGLSDSVQSSLPGINKTSEWNLEYTQNRLKDELVKKFSFLHDISDVLIYTNDGKRIIAYGDRSFKLNLKAGYQKEYLQIIHEQKGKPVWRCINENFEDRLVRYATSAEQMSKSNGILIGRAIKSLDSGEIIGSLIIRINERFFSNVYRNTDIGEGADIFIVDSEGIVVSSRNPKILVGQEYKDTSLIEEAMKNNEIGNRVFNLDIENKQYMVAFSLLDRADWFVVSIIPYSYLNSESTKIWLKILLIGIGCFLFAVLLSYAFSTGISRPLKKLVIAMNEVKHGNLSINIIDSGRDEIVEATRNFNVMLNEIKILMENIKIKEKEKRNAELKALQAQISPHFLSNTLNTVKWLANLQKAENIENIVTSMIQLLHVSMGIGGDFISMREEVEYVKSYITIQEYRYYNKFKINFEVETEILEFKILKFLLQPVVENSLIHGIEPMVGQGLIVIKGYRYEDNIKITVTDNGVGIPRDRLEKILESDDTYSKSRFSGIGIKNVHERIRMNFGEQYGLSLESVPNLFTTVEITLPIII